MGSCCMNKHNKVVVERITVQRLKSRQLSVTSPLAWKARSRRTSVYMVNDEDIKQKYIFEEKIGAGYFGTVKVAVPIQDRNKKYACKSIDKTKLKEQKINTLIREIETLSMVDHPNIIKYYETYSDNMYFHIIMEYCTGGDLFEYILNKKNFTENQACNWIFKITSAIVHCHSLGVVHRDLKPENILFESNSDFSDIKIIDFGLSRKLFQSDDLHSIVGSPFYVAPEVLDGNYDSKCDVWSIGVLAYSLLSGRPPFYSDSKNLLYKLIKTEEVDFTHRLWDLISEEAKDFIKFTLIKNHKKRPTAKKALQHSWFSKLLNQNLNINQLDPEILSQLRNFHHPRQLTKAVSSFIIKNLNKYEIERLIRSFNILDKDRTGFISIAEMQKAFEHCNIEICEDELRKIFTNYALKSKAGDKENFDKINYSSFIFATIDKKKLLDKEHLWDVFKTLDTDQLGFISILSLHKAIERTGKKKSIDEIKFMFKEIGLDFDAQIYFDDFCKIIEDDCK